MKRLALAVGLLLLTGAAHAFDTTPARSRIGILQGPEWFAAFHDTLEAELRQRGFDVYTVDASFDELSLDPDRDADWYVEVIPGNAETVDYGGIGVGSRHADVTLGVMVSRVGAEASIYRGRTLELIATESLEKKNTAILPTSVGFGGRSLFAAIALPFVERAQARSVTRSAARELANRIGNAVRGE
jgi:hypothetical protein